MSTRRQDRAQEIARAAAVPLSRVGVRNSRLKDIGELLDMTPGHLLYYFESKTELFMAALREVERDLRTRAETAFKDIEGARERWEWLLDTGAPVGLDDSGLLLWLEAWAEAVHDAAVLELVGELEAAWQGLLTSVLDYGVTRGELSPATDVAAVAEGVSALLDGLTIRVVVGYRGLDHAAAMRLVRMFTGPLLTWREPALADARASAPNREEDPS